MTRPTKCAKEKPIRQRQSPNGYVVDRVEFVIAPRKIVRYYVQFKVKEHYKTGEATKTGYKSFATLHDAVSHIAWWIVGKRYGAAMCETDSLPHGYKLPAYLPECECGHHIQACNWFEWAECPLHDRKTGYFSRLHDKVTAWIEKGLVMPGAIQKLEQE